MKYKIHLNQVEDICAYNNDRELAYRIERLEDDNKQIKKILEDILVELKITQISKAKEALK